MQQEAEEAVNKISRTFSTLSEKQLDEQLDGVTDFLDSLTCSTTNSRKTNQPKQPDAASIERRNITDCKRKPVKPEFYDPSDPKTPQSSNKKRKPQASYQYVSSDDENYFINDDDNDKQSRNKKIKQNNKYEYGDEYSDDEDSWKSSSVVAAPDSSAGTAAKTDEVPPPNNSSSSSSSVVAAPDSSTKEGVPITQPMPLSKELTDNDGIVVLSERINQMVSIFAKLKMYIINKT